MSNTNPTKKLGWTITTVYRIKTPGMTIIDMLGIVIVALIQYSISISYTKEWYTNLKLFLKITWFCWSSMQTSNHLSIISSFTKYESQVWLGDNEYQKFLNFIENVIVHRYRYMWSSAIIVKAEISNNVFWFRNCCR